MQEKNRGKLDAQECFEQITSNPRLIGSPNHHKVRKQISDIQNNADTGTDLIKFISNFINTEHFQAVQTKRSQKRRQYTYKKKPHLGTYGCFIFKWIKDVVFKHLYKGHPTLSALYNARYILKECINNFFPSDEKAQEKLNDMLINYGTSLAYTLAIQLPIRPVHEHLALRKQLEEDYLIISSCYDLSNISQQSRQNIQAIQACNESLQLTLEQSKEADMRKQESLRIAVSYNKTPATVSATRIKRPPPGFGFDNPTTCTPPPGFGTDKLKLQTYSSQASIWAPVSPISHTTDSTKNNRINPINSIPLRPMCSPLAGWKHHEETINIIPPTI